MSIVAAVVKNKEIAIASDSLTVFGSHREDQTNLVNGQKILKVGSSYIGIAGWGLYANALTHFLAARKRMPRLDTEDRIFAFFLQFLDTMRERYRLLKEHGSAEEKDPFADLDSSFLIANRKGIFGVSGNLSVCHYRKFHAIGSGCDYAFGAMHTVYDTKRTAAEIARAGVEAGIHFDADCGGEIVVHKAL